MAKTRLTEEKRAAIMRFMLAHYDETRKDCERDKLLQQVISKTNVAIRKKYPEDEMVTLRKYGFTTRDACIRFAQGNGRVFGVELDYGSPHIESLADLPNGRGCRSRDVLPATDAFADLVGRYERSAEEEERMREQAKAEYRAFVGSCRTVEDAEAVVTFPLEMKEKLGATSNSLVAVNEDTLSRICSEFQAAA